MNPPENQVLSELKSTLKSASVPTNMLEEASIKAQMNPERSV